MSPWKPLIAVLASALLSGCGDLIVDGLKVAVAGPHAIEYANCPADSSGVTKAAIDLAKQTNHGLGAQLGTAAPLAFGAAARSLSAVGHADLRPMCPPVYHQGPVQSCTGFAIAKGLGEFMLKRLGRPAECSAMYTYTEARRYNFICSKGFEIQPLLTDKGAPISAAMHAFATAGVVKEHVWPYLNPALWAQFSAMDVSNVPASADSTGKAPDAIKWFVSTDPATELTPIYRPMSIVQIPDLAAMKRSLDQQLPVVVGMRVFTSFCSQAVATTGHVPMPGPKETDLGGHAVLVVGYDDAQGVLIVRNSWGPTWGDHGYFYLPYAFVQQGYMRDGWSVKNLNESYTQAPPEAGGPLLMPESR